MSTTSGDPRSDLHRLNSDTAPSAEPVAPPDELQLRAALVRVLRDIIPFLEEWKTHDQARESRQWIALWESMQAARTVLTGDDEIGLMRGDVWALESRTNSGFAAPPVARAPQGDPPAPDEVSMLRAAIRAALNEIGVPGDGYPAPVANAHTILTDAIARPTAAPFGPDGVASSGGTETHPLSKIAASAVDLGPADLSSTFRQRRVPAPQGDPPEQTSESYGSVAGMLAHARRVAAELRRLHPAPTDGSEDSVEGEATHVIRRLTKLLTAAPVRTGRMDLHDELDRRFPIYDDFAAFVRGVPAPQGDAAPVDPFVLIGMEGRDDDEAHEAMLTADLAAWLAENPREYPFSTSTLAAKLVRIGWRLGRGGASSSGSAPTGSPPHDPPREPTHYAVGPRWPIGGPYPCGREAEERGAAHCSTVAWGVDCVKCLRALVERGAAPAPPPPDNDASRPVRAAAWRVIRDFHNMGTHSLAILERELGAYDSPVGASAPTPEIPIYVWRGPHEGMRAIQFPEIEDRPVVLTPGVAVELRWVRGAGGVDQDGAERGLSASQPPEKADAAGRAAAGEALSPASVPSRGNANEMCVRAVDAAFREGFGGVGSPQPAPEET